MIGKAIPVAALVLFGLIFVQAAMHKLRRPARFMQSVRDYDLLPGPLVIPAGVILALAELAVLALILLALALPEVRSGMAPRLALAGAGVLLTLYGLAMGANLARRQFDLDCGCTSAQTPISTGLVLRNLGLAALALGAALAGDFAWDGLALGIPCGLALFLGYLTATQLMSNRLAGAFARRTP